MATIGNFLERFGGLVALLAASVGFALLLLPNYAPATTRGISITDVSIESNVSWAEYSARRPVQRAYANQQGLCPTMDDFVAPKEPPSEKVGEVVNFAWTAQGMHERCVQIAAAVLDGETKTTIGELPIEAVFRADMQASDSASYLIWIDIAALTETRTSYAVRIEFYDGMRVDGVRIAYKDSPAFCFPDPCPSLIPSVSEVP